MAVKQTLNAKKTQTKKTRKGVHAKTKESSNKTSKNYKKPYVSQGKI